MTLYEEIYFEITLSGQKSEIGRFVTFLKSGGLDDFFEFSPDYINLDDNYKTADENEETRLIFTNDEWGIETDEFDTDEFLDVFCRAAKNLDIQGTLYDIEDEEYSFVSNSGDGYYVNAKNITDFNDELDEQAREEDGEEI